MYVLRARHHWLLYITQMLHASWRRLFWSTLYTVYCNQRVCCNWMNLFWRDVGRLFHNGHLVQEATATTTMTVWQLAILDTDIIDRNDTTMCTGPVGPQHACHDIHGYITNRRRITRTTTVDKFACDRFTFASVYNTHTIIYRQPLRQQQAIDVIEDMGWRISMATEQPPETTYLFQHISAAIQRGIMWPPSWSLSTTSRSHSDHKIISCNLIF